MIENTISNKKSLKQILLSVEKLFPKYDNLERNETSKRDCLLAKNAISILYRNGCIKNFREKSPVRKNIENDNIPIEYEIQGISVYFDPIWDVILVGTNNGGAIMLELSSFSQTVLFEKINEFKQKIKKD
jgi:hypothetical protein